MIQASEARQLCSKSEWKLVESSFPPVVETLTLSELKSRSVLAEKLHRRSVVLVGLQHSESRKRVTRRKSELFAEVAGRFEANRKYLEAAHRFEPPSINVESKEKAAGKRELAMAGLRDRAARELESRKSHVVSAFAVRAEQRGARSGATRIQSQTVAATRRRQVRRDRKGG